MNSVHQRNTIYWRKKIAGDTKKWFNEFYPDPAPSEVVIRKWFVEFRMGQMNTETKKVIFHQCTGSQIQKRMLKFVTIWNKLYDFLRTCYHRWYSSRYFSLQI